MRSELLLSLGDQLLTNMFLSDDGVLICNKRYFVIFWQYLRKSQLEIIIEGVNEVEGAYFFCRRCGYAVGAGPVSSLGTRFDIRVVGEEYLGAFLFLHQESINYINIADILSNYQYLTNNKDYFYCSLS
jgi:hypothetical protein